jgi:circadian clock protein KaiC
MRLEESRAGIVRTPSGVPGFDSIAFGGLPEQRTTLVSGSAGAGKTTFGLQFLIAGALEHGHPGVLVTFEERPEDIVRNTESFGWALGDLIGSGRITIVDASPAWEGEGEEMGGFDLDGLFARILVAQERSGAQRIVLDSLSALLGRFNARETVRRELGRLISQLRTLQATTVLTVESADDYGSIGGFDVEAFVVDAVVVLRNPLEGDRRRRTVEILKLRGGKHRHGEFPFTIDSADGISVVPLSAIELEKTSSDRIISLGNPGLDRMLAGGVYDDSILIVSGATGTGKTCMSCEFMRPVVDGDERGILVTLEESRHQILRNAAGWGIDLARAEAEGRLDVISLYSGRMGLDDLLLALRRAFAARRPDRVSIDSLTALERTSTRRTFREFIVGLITLLKEQEALALFTYTASSITGDDVVTEAYVSTMSDGILLLRYIEVDGEIRRGVAVLKMRGTPHDLSIRQYEISASGMEVGQPIGELSLPYLGQGLRRTNPLVDGTLPEPG